MHFAFHQQKFVRQSIAFIIVSVFLLQVGCGPEDYQQPIQQFRDASNVVISSTRSFLNGMNLIEQNAQLDRAVFEKQEINLPKLDRVQIISQEEIKIRADAMDALSQYTSNLAQLAQGKAGSDVGASTTKLSTSLKTLADDARKIPGGAFDNAKFSGIASAAASAVGAVAQLIVQHRARREIEQSIENNDAAITALINQISDDAKGAYLRQRSTLGDYGDHLFRDYENAIKKNTEPLLLLNLVATIKSYRAQKVQIDQANPAPAIDKMKMAHEALVSYARSNKSPKSFAELKKAVEEFANAAQPLGQAVQSLASNLK